MIQLYPKNKVPKFLDLINQEKSLEEIKNWFT